MHEISKGGEPHLKRRDLSASRFKPWNHPLRLKLIAGIKGVEQIDMRHPAINLPIMRTPDRLNRLPNIVAWHGNHSALVGFMRWHR
jgi:hypothetical protein